LKRPDFIMAGATRSGLGALAKILDSHPQIYIPTRKEHRFFGSGRALQLALDSCMSDFKNAVDGKVGNQISENRILHGEEEFDPARAREGAPMAKVIFTLRDPVERTYLQYLYAREDRREKARNFIQAIEEELSGKRSPDTTGKCWIYKNQYQTHIEHWLSFFPRDRVHIMVYEEWTDINGYKTALKELAKFLELPSSKPITENCADVFEQETIEPLPKKYPPLSSALKEQMDDILSLDKTYIANFLGRDIPAWNTKK